MKVELEVNLSSATLVAAYRECERQFSAMGLHYPRMVREGGIPAAVAESRRAAMDVARQCLARVADAVRQAEGWAPPPPPAGR